MERRFVFGRGLMVAEAEACEMLRWIIRMMYRAPASRM